MILTRFPRWLLFASLGAVLALGLVASKARGGPRLRTGLPLREACRSAGVRYPPPRPSVQVRKSERTLNLYSGETLVKAYRVGLGPDPVGHKAREGDGRTPEGKLYVCTRLKQSRYHRFMGLSYPTPADAARGLESGVITAAEKRSIEEAHQRRRQPLWNTALGGAVGLHGRGGGSDWTLGCVAVEDAEIEELFEVLPLGTPVNVLP
jgi:hypothetical protein